MSQMTYQEMRDRVSDMLHDRSAKTVSLINSYINAHMKRYANAREWSSHLYAEITENLTTVAGQTYLAFPEDCAYPVKLTDRSNDYTMVERDLGQLHSDHVSRIDQTGDLPIYYARLGILATRAPLNAAGTVSVQTELSTDISVDVVVTGLRNDPEVRDREVITTLSSAPQSSDSDGAVTWREGWSILSISTTANLNGYIEIHETDTTSNVLAILTEHSKSSQYFVIKLQNDPNSAYNLNLVYKRKVMDLVEDDDIPVIPVSDAIVEATIASMRRHDEQYTQASAHDNVADAFFTAAVADADGHSHKSSRSRPAAARFRRKMRGF